MEGDELGMEHGKGGRYHGDIFLVLCALGKG